MAGQTQFINVMKGPTGPLSFNITLIARNNPTPLNLVVPIVFAAAADEKTAAQFICDTLNTALFNLGIYYGDVPTGTPQFEMTSGYYTVMPRIWSCDHYVNVWAQAQYSLSIDAITPADTSANPRADALIVISSGPIYTTLAEGISLSKIYQLQLNKCTSSDLEIVNLLQTASDELRSMAGFFITASQYLHEDKMGEESGFHLSYPPIIAFDNPAFGGPSIATIIYSVAGIRSRGTVDMDTGHVDFGVEKSGMFRGMALKMTYVGGYPTIDSILKSQSIRLAKLQTQSERILSMRGGSGSVTFESPTVVRKDVRQQLRSYLGRR